MRLVDIISISIENRGWPVDSVTTSTYTTYTHFTEREQRREQVETRIKPYGCDHDAFRVVTTTT